jgi:hypothetical protein
LLIRAHRRFACLSKRRDELERLLGRRANRTTTHAIAAIAIMVTTIDAAEAPRQLLDATTSSVTLPSVEAPEVTTAFVRVLKLRPPDGSASGTSTSESFACDRPV